MKFNRKILLLILSVCGILLSSSPILADEIDKPESTEEVIIESEEESVVSDEEVSSESLEPSIEDIVEGSDETVNESTDIEVIVPIQVSSMIDDNTLLIEGTATPESDVVLLDSENNELVSDQADSSGYFQLKLVATLEADEKLRLVAIMDNEVVSELEISVEQSGLFVEEVTIDSEFISGHTSPDRLVQLIDSEGRVIDSAKSDDKGNFNLGEEIHFVGGVTYNIHVLDDNRLAREVELTIAPSDISEAESGELTILSVPSHFDFESVSLNTFEDVILNRVGDESLEIVVMDTRTDIDPETTEWSIIIYTQQSMRLTSDGDIEEELNSAMYFNGEMIEGRDNAYTLASRSDFDYDGNGQYTYVIPTSQDFYLKLNSFKEAVEGEYNATIHWEIVDGIH